MQHHPSDIMSNNGCFKQRCEKVPHQLYKEKGSYPHASLYTLGNQFNTTVQLRAQAKKALTKRYISAPLLICSKITNVNNIRSFVWLPSRAVASNGRLARFVLLFRAQLDCFLLWLHKRPERSANVSILNVLPTLLLICSFTTVRYQFSIAVLIASLITFLQSHFKSHPYLFAHVIVCCSVYCPCIARADHLLPITKMSHSLTRLSLFLLLKKLTN